MSIPRITIFHIRPACEKSFRGFSGRFFHVFLFRRLKSKSYCRKSVCDKIYKQKLDGNQHYRHSHEDSHKHCQHFPNVAGQQVTYKFSDIGVNASSLFHCIYQRCKVVVHQDHVCRLLVTSVPVTPIATPTSASLIARERRLLRLRSLLQSHLFA